MPWKKEKHQINLTLKGPFCTLTQADTLTSAWHPPWRLLPEQRWSGIVPQQLSQLDICCTDATLDPKPTRLINLTNCHFQNLNLDLWPSIASICFANSLHITVFSFPVLLFRQRLCSHRLIAARRVSSYKSRRVRVGGSEADRKSSLK